MYEKLALVFRRLWLRGFDLAGKPGGTGMVGADRLVGSGGDYSCGNGLLEQPVIYPEAICTGNWMVLFENGDVFPVKYFIGKDQQMLETSKRAVAVMVDGPGERVFLLELGEAPHMALH